MLPLWSKLRRSFAGRQSVAEDLQAELAAHLELEIQDRLDAGMSPEAARQEARRHLGNLTTIEERAREAWTFRSFETLAKDLRFGLRGLRRSPGFALVVIATLALGIGANTALFSVVNAVLLRPLPYPAAERLMHLEEWDPKAEDISVTWVNYQHWLDESHSFEAMAAFEMAQFTLTGRAEPLFTRAGLVTNGYFGLMGAKPLLGRVFSAAEDRPGAPATVVLSYPFWVDKMGSDSQVLGSVLNLNGAPYQVIGVLSPFQPFTKPLDFYIPLGLSEGATVDRSRHRSMRVLARLKPRVSEAAALADLNAIMQRLAQTDPGPESSHRAYGRFLASSMTEEVRPALLILLGAVGLVLIIACVNVASLVLARSTARTREIAIRAAIGAGRTRLIRQLLTENLLLAALGGFAGLLLAAWSLRALIGIAPREIPRLAQTSFDWRVALFVAAVTILAGLLTGLAPIWAAGRTDLVSALKDSSRSVFGGRGGEASRSALVVAEIALTLILAFAAGLLIRSLIRAETADPGFAPDHLLALELVLPSSYGSPPAIQSFYTRLKQDLRGLPGVTAVGAVNCPPSAGDCNDWFYSIADRPAPAPSEVPISLLNNADTQYFATMHIPVREGRAFTSADVPGTPLVAVVNEVFARRWWANSSAVGHRIKLGGPYRDGATYEIVGVAGNVSQIGLDSEPMPEIYMPYSQAPSRAAVIMIRTTASPELLESAVRRHLAAIDRNLAIESLRPFEQTVAASLARRRFSTLLLASFAALAMLLAAVGIYGLLNYWVRIRHDEIAIRMALGAQGYAILRWIAGQTLRLVAAGMALGMVGAWMASRWMASLVFGVSARNAGALLEAALAVLATAVIASALPAWRAIQVDAAGRLRHT